MFGAQTTTPPEVALTLERDTGGGDVGGLAGQADMGEDALDDGRIGDEGDEHAASVAVGAGFEVFWNTLAQEQLPRFKG